MKAATICSTLVAVSLMLGSCGGGDSSSSSPPPGSQNPTPTPTPTPTPSPIVDNGRGTISTYAPFGVEADTPMAVLGIIRNADGTSWLNDQEVELVWLANPRTFDLKIPGYGVGRIADDPDSEARAASYLVSDAGQLLASTLFYIPGNPRLVDRFALSAAFGPPDKGASGSTGAFFYFATSAIEPPTSGSAKYLIGDRLNTPCSGRLEVDFTEGTVSGEVCSTWEDDWGPYPEAKYSIAEGRYNRETGEVTGSFAIPESGFEGEIRGQMLGKAGEVLALVVRGAVYNPYDLKWEQSWHFYRFENLDFGPIF